ncbi:hypothetical protein KO02_13820 [Sphingobacterium sp. ML3W]|nr:hypothetical protein KO02_13820 [Sphingobacterium sp. ML3W]
MISLMIGCGTSNAQTNSVAAVSPKYSLQKDTIQIRETFNKEDLTVNEYLTGRLKPIRANFKRINSIANWTSIITEDIWESTEGGVAKYYYLNGTLEKILSRHLGETGQLLTEYYLQDGQLSFVFEKSYQYNRPIYQDATLMKELGDTEIFDMAKSQITEDRNYFENGELIHQFSNLDCGAPFASDYLLQEQKRINEDFNRLMK